MPAFRAAPAGVLVVGTGASLAASGEVSNGGQLSLEPNTEVTADSVDNAGGEIDLKDGSSITCFVSPRINSGELSNHLGGKIVVLGQASIGGLLNNDAVITMNDPTCSLAVLGSFTQTGGGDLNLIADTNNISTVNVIAQQGLGGQASLAGNLAITSVPNAAIRRSSYTAMTWVDRNGAFNQNAWTLGKYKFTADYSDPTRLSIFCPDLLLVLNTPLPNGLTGQPYTVQATFHDDGGIGLTASDYLATIDWGDFSGTTFGLVSGSYPDYTVTGTHTYQSSNTWGISILVTDTVSDVSWDIGADAVIYDPPPSGDAGGGASAMLVLTEPGKTEPTPTGGNRAVLNPLPAQQAGSSSVIVPVPLSRTTLIDDAELQAALQMASLKPTQQDHQAAAFAPLGNPFPFSRDALDDFFLAAQPGDGLISSPSSPRTP